MRRSWWWNGMALAVCALALSGGDRRAAAQDKPPDRKAVDTSVYNTLRAIINQGADLFNEPNHDHNGCYRLYEGALLSIRPFLDHRPALQKMIDEGIASAKTRPDLASRAFALRDVINKIRADVNPNPKMPASLWEKLGGEANVKKVIDDFVAGAAPDPKVDFTRGGKYPVDVPKLKKSLLEQISGATGGPYKYMGKSMKEVHKGMGITDAQFDAAAAHLLKALEKNGAKPDDIKAVMGVIGSTKADIVEKKPVVDPPKKTLWENLGGEANVKKVIDDFVKAAASDEKVDFSRGGKYKLDGEAVAKLKKSLLEQISGATGGPYKYTGKSMKEVHKGMAITEAQFDAAAGHLKMALEKNKAMPDDVKAVMGVIGSTRADIVEKKPVDPPKMSLWEKLGGETNVKKVVEDFVNAAAADPKVDFFRTETLKNDKYKLDATGVTKLKQLLVDQISAATGGPREYKGKSMKEVHKGMAITEEQFDALAGHLKAALEKNKAMPEDVKTVMTVIGGTKADIVEKKP